MNLYLKDNSNHQRFLPLHLNENATYNKKMNSGHQKIGVITSFCRANCGDMMNADHTYGESWVTNFSLSSWWASGAWGTWLSRFTLLSSAIHLGLSNYNTVCLYLEINIQHMVALVSLHVKNCSIDLK